MEYERNHYVPVWLRHTRSVSASSGVRAPKSHVGYERSGQVKMMVLRDLRPTKDGASKVSFG